MRGTHAKSANEILFVRSGEEPFEQLPYLVHVLADHWRERGLTVSVTDRLGKPAGPDVLVFPHFDLTVTPKPYRELFGRCARVINRSVTDISKRTISRQLVTGPDQYDGPVIVKTNRNYGGVPEARAAARRGAAARCMLKALRRLPWTFSGVLGRDSYRIYDHPRLVPRPVWMNPLLVVEKFLPEREDELYCVRQYVFLGECEINTRAMSPHPLVKSKNVVRREVLDETPPQLRAFRDMLGFDFGKFDYVMNGDQPVVFDVNRTPTYDPTSKAGSAGSLIGKLAPGIHAFLGDE